MIVGIDPDLDKSGVALLGDNGLQLINLTFFDLCSVLEIERKKIKKVYVEAGWLNKKSNFHNIDKNMPIYKRLAICEKVAKNVGENHATGKLIVEMAKGIGLEVVLVKPTSKKLDQNQFKKITGYGKRTNQEQRDAAMLIIRERKNDQHI